MTVGSKHLFITTKVYLIQIFLTLPTIDLAKSLVGGGLPMDHGCAHSFLVRICSTAAALLPRVTIGLNSTRSMPKIINLNNKCRIDIVNNKLYFTQIK